MPRLRPRRPGRALTALVLAGLLPPPGLGAPSPADQEIAAAERRGEGAAATPDDYVALASAFMRKSRAGGRARGLVELRHAGRRPRRAGRLRARAPGGAAHGRPAARPALVRPGRVPARALRRPGGRDRAPPARGRGRQRPRPGGPRL